MRIASTLSLASNMVVIFLKNLIHTKLEFIFSADKLMMEAENQLTFYVDRRINNDFMTHAVADVQAMSDIAVPTIHTQVRNTSNM